MAPATRIQRLAVPYVPGLSSPSVRAAERELERLHYDGTIFDVTYADTKRWPAPDWVMDQFQYGYRVGDSYTPYRGDVGVRETVAPSIAKLLSVDIDPLRNLILTPGTQGALFALVASLIDPGDVVILLDPEYLASERLLRYHGAEVVRVPIRWEQGADPSPDMEALEQAMSAGAKALMFSHPNNPTGAVYPEAVIAAIAELAVHHGVTVVADELYSRLVYDGLDFPHLRAQPGMDDLSVTLLGPSKTESMSGFRVGVAAGPPDLVDAMEDVLSVSALRAPAYAQHLLSRWLVDDLDFLAQRIGDYQEMRDSTYRQLKGHVEVHLPRGTAYMYVRPVGVRVDEQSVALALKREAGIVVNPGYQFGSAWASFFRICFAQEESRWDAALQRMIELFEHLREVQPR